MFEELSIVHGDKMELDESDVPAAVVILTHLLLGD
jgi:hypothetical protein